MFIEVTSAQTGNKYMLSLGDGPLQMVFRSAEYNRVVFRYVQFASVVDYPVQEDYETIRSMITKTAGLVVLTKDTPNADPSSL